MIIAIIITLVLLGMKYLKQPYAIAYILSGVILGVNGLGLIDNVELMAKLGDIGVILLLFFVGMEISLPKLLSNWKIAILGTIGQIIITALFSIVIGNYFNWSVERSILTSFVIVLSSTAVVIKLLEDNNDLKTKIGQNALAISIVQDIAVIPMIMILTFFSNKNVSLPYTSILGTIIFIIIIVILLRNPLRLPFSKIVHNDHELQVFLAIIFCLTGALISEFFGLSMAMGAFIAGILVSTNKDTHWVKNSLLPFKVLFLALFFIYIGVLINIKFIIHNYIHITIWVLFIFIINTLINTIILMLLDNSFKESIYISAVLAQAGEFGFLLIDIGYKSEIIQAYDYNLSISVIALTLLLSPFWIKIVKLFMRVDKKYLQKLRENYILQLKSAKKGKLKEF